MNSSLESILGAETLAAFETPGAVAQGLPAAAYTSEAFFALENERIFGGSWVFAGLAHELESPGDVVPVTVAGKPVLLVRDADGEVRAFYNVCRHRCLKLVDRPGNAGPTIQCPYHSWSYRLDGALHLTPYFGGHEPRAVPDGFDRAQHGLIPVGVATWHDWIFVNLSGDAPPIEEFVAPLQSWIGGFDFTRMRHGRDRRPGRDRRELEAPDGELHRALPRPVRAPHDHRTAAHGSLHGERAGLPRMRG